MTPSNTDDDDEAAPISSLVDVSIERLARSRATVLLRGGTRALAGRVARALHDRSGRDPKLFEELDCAHHDDAEIEVRLFGGPVYQPSSVGLIHRLEEGTLFLAHIEHLPRMLQPRFFTVLDGDRRARVVTHTASDLTKSSLRSDLLQRLLLVEVALYDVG